MGLAIQLLQDGALATLPARFDATTVANMRGTLDQLVERAQGDVTLDLREVEVIDSSGIGAVVFLFKRLTAQGRRLFLCNLRGQPQELLSALRIDRMIPVKRQPLAAERRPFISALDVPASPQAWAAA